MNTAALLSCASPALLTCFLKVRATKDYMADSGSNLSIADVSIMIANSELTRDSRMALRGMFSQAREFANPHSKPDLARDHQRLLKAMHAPQPPFLPLMQSVLDLGRDAIARSDFQLVRNYLDEHRLMMPLTAPTPSSDDVSSTHSLAAGDDDSSSEEDPGSLSDDDVAAGDSDEAAEEWFHAAIGWEGGDREEDIDEEDELM
jgi:hypothetical protein